MILKRHAVAEGECCGIVGVASATMDVMMKMTTADVRRLRAQFATNLTLEQFVPLMKMNLRDRIANELDFVVGAVDLFHTIDVNGDKALEWDEFAGYMLDAGQAKADFAYEMDGHDGKLYQQWDLAFRDAKTPLNRVKSHVQQLLYLSDLCAVAYFEHAADVVAIYGLHFDQNEAPRHLATIRLHTAFQEHVVLDMCYVPIKRWLVVSSMRRPLAYLSVWQMPEFTSTSRSPMMLRRIELASPQEQLTWLPTLQLLATASAVYPSLAAPNQRATKIHQLLLWDLATLTTLSDFDHRERIKGVTSMVGFATPSDRVFLVVGREDGQLTVVETETGHDVQTLDAHGHGVRMLAFSSEYEVIASAGAHAYAGDESSHYILIWCIGSSGRLRVEATLRDHEAPLQLLQFVDSKQQLLSADIHGVFHVYSSAGRSPQLEKWQCLQVFDASYHIDRCVVVPETNSSDAVLITAGARVAFFDLCVSREREEIVFAYYCRELNFVLGVTATTVLLWKADTGILWKSFAYASIVRSTPPSGYNDAADDDARSGRVISAVCVDDRERKLLLGDDRGSVRVVNIVNGNVMKALDPHDSAVLWLSYVLKSKRVLSISLDAVLHVCDENNPVGYYVPFGSTRPHSVVLRSLRFLPDTSSSPQPSCSTGDTETSTPPASAAKFELTRAIGNQALDLLAVLMAGTRNGESFIQLWNFDLTHTQGTCVPPRGEEITCLSFFGSSAHLVGGTAQGVAYLWMALPSEGTSYRCAIEFSAAVDDRKPDEPNEASEEEEKSSSCPKIPLSNSQILHILTVSIDSGVASEESSPETSTFLTADGAPTAAPAAAATTSLSQSVSSGGMMPLLANDRIVEKRRSSEAVDGTYVVTADENGRITTWYIAQEQEATSNNHKSTTTQSAAPTPSKGRQNTALLQHEEMAVGYEAIVTLHTTAQQRSRRHVQHHGITVCKARARWQAHCSAVASLRQSSGDPLVLLSSSASGKVKIWSVTGELLGVLDHFATRRIPERRPWRFPVDMTQRRREKEAFAEQFLDRCNSSESSKRSTARMTVLQERLSMTPQEMATERSSTPKSMRRRITTVVQLGDVERAIRHLALSQVSSLPARGTNGSRTRARSVTSAPANEPSLHALLTEVSGMKPPATAPAGDTATAADTGASGGRRRYSMVTVANLKQALRPRSFTPQHSKTKANRSLVAVHCDLAPLPGSAQRTRELIVTNSVATDGRIELSDLRSGLPDSQASNQENEKKPVKKRADGVLNYHVKLAHSWNKYAT